MSPETIAAELIKERGPQGETYLTAEHTLGRLRSLEFVPPRLAVSGLHAAWAAAGSRDTYALARERVRQMAALAAPPIPDDRVREMGEIIARFSAGS